MIKFQKHAGNLFKILKHKKNVQTFFFTTCLFYFCLIYKNQNEKWEERLNSEKEEK